MRVGVFPWLIPCKNTSYLTRVAHTKRSIFHRNLILLYTVQSWESWRFATQESIKIPEGPLQPPESRYGSPPAIGPDGNYERIAKVTWTAISWIWRVEVGKSCQQFSHKMWETDKDIPSRHIILTLYNITVTSTTEVEMRWVAMMANTKSISYPFCFESQSDHASRGVSERGARQSAGFSEAFQTTGSWQIQPGLVEKLSWLLVQQATNQEWREWHYMRSIFSAISFAEADSDL